MIYHHFSSKHKKCNTYYNVTPKLRKSWTLKISIFWNVHCVLTNHVGDLATAENEWVSQSRNRFGSKFVSKDLHLNLQEFKLLLLSIWDPHTLRERKMCEWACGGCIVATAVDCWNQCSLLFYNPVPLLNLKMCHFQNLQLQCRCCTMQARLEGMDDSL